MKYYWKKKIKVKSDQASKTTNSQEVQETEEHVKQNEFLAFSICCGENFKSSEPTKGMDSSKHNSLLFKYLEKNALRVEVNLR